MSDSDLEFLRTAPDGERWVYMAGELKEIKQNQAADFGRLNAHDRRLDAVDRRCAGRRWQGKVMWVALAAGLSAWIERLVGSRG